jgi:LPXTG-motif cell wall-anchored protein
MRRTQKTAVAQHQEHSQGIRDFLLYIAVGVSVAVLAVTLGVYQAKTGDQPADLLKWVGFAVMTLLVFLWAIRRYRRLWRNTRFWKLIGAFAAIHFIVGIGLLFRTTVTSLVPFVIVTPLEYFLLRAFLSRSFPEGTDF